MGSRVLKPAMLLVILLILIPPAYANGWSKPEFLIEASHPSMIQDNNGIYWLAFNGAGQDVDIFLMNSTDGRIWSDPWHVTSDPESDRDPQLIQDSKGNFWLVFVSYRMGNPDLFLKNSDDGITWSEAIQITRDKAFDSYPNTLIQDSDGIYWIAFSSSRGGGGDTDVYLTGSEDGVLWSEPLHVTNDESIETFPTMIQDSDGIYWLAFARQTGWPNKYDIFLTKSEDGNRWTEPEKVSRGPANNNYIDFIQDKNGLYWMAFTSERTGNEDIFVMGSYDAQTWSEPELLSYNMINRTYNFKCDYKTLMQDSYNVFWIVYGCAKRPDGLWYVTGRDVELYFVESEGVTTTINTTFGDILLKQLTTSTYPQGKPSFSFDGKKIAYISKQENQEGDLWIMDAEGDNKKQLTFDISAQDFPAWRPDGKIIYSSKESDNWDIWIMDPLSGKKGALTSDPHNQFFASYSPDGKEIVYVSDEAGNNDIWIMDSDTSDKRQLTFDKSHQNAPAWSPDGKEIAFESILNGNWDIFVMDADGSNILQLTNETANQGGPTWSPYGKIAFESDQEGNFDIWIMNTDGSEKTRITANDADEVFPIWDPDGEGIVYESLQAGNSDVWGIDISRTALASKRVPIEKETHPMQESATIAPHPNHGINHNDTLNKSLDKKEPMDDNSSWITRILVSIVEFFFKIFKDVIR
ncbi:MAG: exo-alpha-sialidase [Thermodesulfobacteriota bacterium]